MIKTSQAVLVAIILTAVPAIAGTLVGSKHDLTGLNARARVDAMNNLAFNDYRDPCIYCHIPDSAKNNKTAPGKQQIDGWNRYIPQGEIQTYSSATFDNEIKLGPESLLCLSCHDGTMAVDMVVSKPAGWKTSMDAPMHMRLDRGGGLDKCTQCHDGTTAHRMDTVIIGRSLMDDHPVGVKYPGLTVSEDFFKPNQEGKFRNGVRLFNDQVECASCHDVHNPDVAPFLRVETKELCLTCHNK